VISLQDLAHALGGTCVAGPEILIQRVATLENATPQDLIFILESKYLSQLDSQPCIAAIVGAPVNSKKPHIIVKNPRKALAQTLQLLYPDRLPLPSTHASALIAATAQVSDTASIGAFASIGENSTISDNTRISERVSIGDNCTIGKNCRIYPGVTLYSNTQIGDNVIIHAGSVIGSDGFGYVPDTNAVLKMPHIGRVVIEDHVEIGANCAIDRGCLGDTRIGNGAKIDNLVHISHNTTIGPFSMIAAQCGFVGSATVGAQVQIGGQVGVSRVSIGDRCIIAAKSGVTKDIPSGETISGFPAWNHRDEIQKEAFIRKLYKEHRSSKNA
jgi:UDP-3-O-[3-hydroxymyristoyl] glucosamine N-acyltransferase